jgi:CubicO group peptidase (beta-lactamase class C family)
MKPSYQFKSILSTLVLLISCTIMPSILEGQNIIKLPRSTPENEGISSAGILDFLNAVDTGRVELHSYMFIRHGKVVSEGWWDPYGPDYKHIMFSASKTFTATAIGLAISENRLKLTDKVNLFFPYSLPDTLSDFIKELTVENLLTMSVGQDHPSLGYGKDDDWISEFLKTSPSYKPGTVFKYNNMATYMLSAIVQQVTGQTVFDYLRPRIFQPLEIRGIDWESNPQGINLGAAGLRLHTEDMAKFGLLLLQNGVWNNKQLIPKEWVSKATSFKIQSSDPGNKRPKNLNDWEQGYCYQMWRGRNNTVRLDGAGGQFVILIPDKDAVVVLTAGARITQDELDLVHNYLIPAIKSDKPLPEDQRLFNMLVQRQTALNIKPSSPILSKSEFEAKISGKEFLMGDNDAKIQSVYFVFKNNECDVAIKKDNNISILKAGLESWRISNTKLGFLLAPPRLGLSSLRSIDANYTVPQLLIKVAARYSWMDNNTLQFSTRAVEESISSRNIVCSFSEINGNIYVTIQQSVIGMALPMEAKVSVPITGTLVELK